MASTEGRNYDPYSRVEKGWSYDEGVENSSSSNGKIVWEEKIRNLRDIINNGKYPCVVKVKNGNIQKYEKNDVDYSADDFHSVDDPILHVLELRRRKVVVATKLQWDRRSGDYTSEDKQTDIQVSQKGWLEVIPENGQPVEYFDTVNAIVGIRSDKFLVRTSIVGYQLTVENGVSSWSPWEIRPGEVLTKGIVHMDQKKVKKKTLFKRIFSGGKNTGKKEQEIKYLQCFDSDNREIMVPLIMSGVFSPVGDQSVPNYDAVYNLHDLISAFDLPVKAQLIHTDSIGKSGIPSGVLRFDSLKDSDAALVARHPYTEGNGHTFEIPLSDDIQVIREKKKKVKKPSLVNQDEINIGTTEDVQPEVFSEIPVSLPVRVKDPKRSKGSALLEKLSVRSKGKKERASLKVLQEQGVFSSRMSKSEINFEDFGNDIKDDDIEDAEPDFPNDSVQDKLKTDGYKSKRELDIENGYTVTSKLNSVQDRDLPPIPVKTRSPRRHNKPSKESVYEELPLAPRPPNGEATYTYRDGEPGEDYIDDGYMTPARFRELNEEGSSSFDVVKRKPPTAPRDSLRYTKMRKARSDYSSNVGNNENDINIDQLFDFTYNTDATSPVTENIYEKRRNSGHYNQMKISRAQFEQEAQLRQRFYEENRQFCDDTMLEPRPLNGVAKFKSRSHKNLNFEGNVTIRSHNVRKMRTAMEVFNFSDSLRDLRQSAQNGIDEPNYGRVVDSERVKSYVYDSGPYSRNGGSHYVESEPAYRKYHRSSSVAALSDSYPKHGDDSAISLCSRGEYGTLHGESEYSYSEYSEWHDDGFLPPDDISGLSVLEVSKSLRYIGMKDRVVIRFSREQIDGNMLCSLDKKLLKEGFPELNALDIKKIVDFIGGWRPKK